jgi:hypothetical protein
MTPNNGWTAKYLEEYPLKIRPYISCFGLLECRQVLNGKEEQK